MKAIAFNGSPRPDGNTAVMLERVLNPIAEAGIATELVQVGGKPVRGCTACGRCIENKDRRCVIGGDIVNDCIAKMIGADAMQHMFLMSRMIVPGSTYWNFGVGLEKGDVLHDDEALANMQDLGETIAWLVKSLKSS